MCINHAIRNTVAGAAISMYALVAVEGTVVWQCTTDTQHCRYQWPIRQPNTIARVVEQAASPMRRAIEHKAREELSILCTATPMSTDVVRCLVRPGQDYL
jgi:hypothetical protein